MCLDNPFHDEVFMPAYRHAVKNMVLKIPGTRANVTVVSQLGAAYTLCFCFLFSHQQDQK